MARRDRNRYRSTKVRPRVRCPECRLLMTVKLDGRVTVHGPYSGRCVGSDAVLRLPLVAA